MTVIITIHCTRYSIQTGYFVPMYSIMNTSLTVDDVSALRIACVFLQEKIFCSREKIICVSKDSIPWYRNVRHCLPTPILASPKRFKIYVSEDRVCSPKGIHRFLKEIISSFEGIISSRKGITECQLLYMDRFMALCGAIQPIALAGPPPLRIRAGWQKINDLDSDFCANVSFKRSKYLQSSLRQNIGNIIWILCLASVTKGKKTFLHHLPMQRLLKTENHVISRFVPIFPRKKPIPFMSTVD